MYQKFYLLALFFTLVITTLSLKKFKRQFKKSEANTMILIMYIICIIPVINCIWLVGLIINMISKDESESVGKYYLMIHYDKKSLFIYNEKQMNSNTLSEHGYDCLSFNEDINKVIETGHYEALKNNQRFNSAYSKN